MSLLLSPFSPFSKVKVTPYSTTVTTENMGIMSPMMSPIVSPIVSPMMSPILSPRLYPNVLSPTFYPNAFSPRVVVPGMIPLYQLEVDTGLNENPFAQKQMLDFVMAKVYNKWIYGKDMCYVLKYLKVVDGKVTYLTSTDEFKNNKICDDSETDVELKVDFIEEHILTKSDLKKLLKRMIDELGFKWYEFPQKLDVIAEAVEKHIKKSLKHNIGGLAH